ncbi:putative transposase, Ptta/En/Spm, plant [Sesbania bispinosa]|nr:putative transposase, Ptta/En/Spm, plant [Sesbania bispinosa]
MPTRPTRGRGRGRGSHTNTPYQPFQPLADPPSLQRSPHSPGATSTIGLSASDGQPSFVTRLVNGDQSATLPTTADPQPSVVPSSEDSHTEVDRRLVISVEDVSNPRRFVPSSLTRDIIFEVISRMPYLADNWKSYCFDMKEMLFNDFKEKYRFSSNYDRTMAKTIWERTCMDKYPDYLAKARAAAFVRANSTNIADLKGHGPKGMRTEVWDGLVDICMTPEWQKKSDAGKSNRVAKPDSMVHTGGSRTFGHHKKKMGRVHDIGRSLDIDILGSTHAPSSDVVDASTNAGADASTNAVL